MLGQQGMDTENGDSMFDAYEYDHIQSVLPGSVFSPDPVDWSRPSGQLPLLKAHVYSPSEHDISFGKGELKLRGKTFEIFFSTNSNLYFTGCFLYLVIPRNCNKSYHLCSTEEICLGIVG